MRLKFAAPDERGEVTLGARVRYNDDLFIVSRLPSGPGQDVMISRPNGNFQDMDFKPEVLGMVWE